MTNIEKDIYKLLDRDKSAFTLGLIASAYIAAYNSPARTYSKIDWTAIHGAIEYRYGKRGLRRCQREAVEQ